MANTWPPERREWYRKMIQQWRPWEKTTGPKTPAGKLRVSRNAYKGGYRKLFREMNKALKQQRRMLDKF